MNIVIVGSGNIATHLAKALYASQHTITQVYSRTLANAQALANVLSSSAIDNLAEIKKTADLYLIAVSDSAIEDIISELPNALQGIVVHTSGATDIKLLDIFFKYGVIYPPQSINKEIQTDISSIPFGIEANKPEIFDSLMALMQPIAPKSFDCNSKQRLALHLSAVLVNNFSNALFEMAHDILIQEGLDFELLKPIILETATKVQHTLPYATQTGPACRGDHNTIDKHLQFLSQSPEVSKIYQLLTDFIIKRYHK